MKLKKLKKQYKKYLVPVLSQLSTTNSKAIRNQIKHTKDIHSVTTQILSDCSPKDLRHLAKVLTYSVIIASKSVK